MINRTDFIDSLPENLRAPYLHCVRSEKEELKSLAREIEDWYEISRASGGEIVEEAQKGDILLGYSSEDEPNFPPHTPIFMTEEEYFSNVICASMTGGGKSVTGSNLAREFAAKGNQVIVYDVKLDHLALCAFENWIWLPTKFNFQNRHIAPPSVPQYAYWESETEIFAVAHDLLNVGTSKLKTIQSLAESRCLKEDPNRKVTDYELIISARELLENTPYKQKSQFDNISRAMDRLGQMTMGPYENSRAVRQGFTHLDFQNVNIVRDISDLGRTRAIYEINHDLNWSFQYAKWNNMRGSAARPVVRIIEESTTFLNPNFVARISNFDDLYRMSREFRQSCVLLVHSLLELPSITKNNTGVWLLMKCSNHEELVEFARISGMDNAHYELAQTLKIGEAICKCRRLPVCVKIDLPYNPLDKRVDRDLLEVKTKKFLEPKMSSLEFVDPSEVEYVMKLIYQTDSWKQRSAEDVAKESAERFRANVDEFVQRIFENPDDPYDKLRGKLSFGKQSGTTHKVKQLVLEQDLIQSYSGIRLGKSSGRSPLHFGLKEKSRDILKRLNLIKSDQPLHDVKGSGLHGIVTRHIRNQYLLRGQRADLESLLCRSDVSVFDEKGSPSIFFEVSVWDGVSSLIKGLVRDFEYGFQEGIVIVIQLKQEHGKKNEYTVDEVVTENKCRKLKEEIEQLLPEFASRIEVRSIKNFGILP
jgi:hypothetical protein